MKTESVVRKLQNESNGGGPRGAQAPREGVLINWGPAPGDPSALTGGADKLGARRTLGRYLSKGII